MRASSLSQKKLWGESELPCFACSLVPGLKCWPLSTAAEAQLSLVSLPGPLSKACLLNMILCWLPKAKKQVQNENSWVQLPCLQLSHCFALSTPASNFSLELHLSSTHVQFAFPLSLSVPFRPLALASCLQAPLPLFMSHLLSCLCLCVSHCAFLSPAPFSKVSRKNDQQE